MSARGAMLAVALAWVAAPVAAQPTVTPLPGGWSMHSGLGIVNGPEGIACGRDRAFIRNWSGDAVMWNGSTWSPLPRQSGSAYGRTAAVSAEGHLFMEASGGIAEWNGTAWIRHALPGFEGDVDTQMAAPSNAEVYRVGNGRIARREGGAFRTYSGGTWRPLHAIAIVGPHVWVAGQGGTVMRHDGRAWTRLATGITGTVHRLVVFGPNDVWALADGTSWRDSTVIRWDGAAWRPAAAGLTAKVQGIGGAAPDAIYAVGEEGIWKWNGTAWAMDLPKATISGMVTGGSPYSAPDDICATDRHILVADRGGRAIVRAR